MTADDTLTTGECAKLVGISLQQIIRVIDRRDLVGFVIPGTKHRRVRVRHLVEWMKKWDIPFPAALAEFQTGAA